MIKVFNCNNKNYLKKCLGCEAVLFGLTAVERRFASKPTRNHENNWKIMESEK